MSDPLTITLAGPGDRDAAISLLASQLAEHHIETAETGIAAAVDGVLADDRYGFLLIAKDAGTVVGVAYVSLIWTLEHGGKSCWLEELYVLPDRRGQGIGAQLLAAVIERAAATGCVAVDLEIDRSHDRAANLYERHGFRPLPRARWVRSL